jgi:FkbM family methyltransferase
MKIYSSKALSAKLAPLLPRRLHYCEAGARGGIGTPWTEFEELLEITGFEPEESECARLQKLAAAHQSFYPYALNDSPGPCSFHVTKKASSSSIYKPNRVLLDNFPIRDWFDVVSVESLVATTLDELSAQKKFGSVDFLKLDVQGAELNILRGGRNVVGSEVLAIELEVEFAAVYENQPLFADVDNFLRGELGFQLQDLRHSYWKAKPGMEMKSLKGQLVFGDALYFRPASAVVNLGKEKALLAAVCGLAYGYPDYALQIIEQAEAAKILDTPTAGQWRGAIQAFGKSLRFWNKGNQAISNFIYLVQLMVEPYHRSWWASTRRLGSIKKFGWFA